MSDATHEEVIRTLVSLEERLYAEQARWMTEGGTEWASGNMNGLAIALHHIRVMLQHPDPAAGHIIYPRE